MIAKEVGYKNKRILDTQNFLLYVIDTLGEVKGYTKINRILYLTKKHLQERGFDLEYEF